MLNIKTSYSKIYETVLILTIGILPLIDSMNGFIMETYNISIALAYRAIALLVLIIYVYNKNYIKNTVYISIAIIYFILIGLVSSLGHNEINGLVKELSTASKFIFIIAIIESFKNVMKNPIEAKELVDKIINMNMILFPLCLIIPMVLGVGYDVYHGAGNKGFFNANNELGIVLSVLFIFSTDDLYKKINIKNIVIFTGIVISMVAIGSKVGLLFPIIVIALYFVKSIFNFTIKYKFTLIIVLISMTIIFIVKLLFNDMLISILDRQEWLYNNVESTAIFLILSGRNILLEIIHNDFIHSPNILFKLIFGYGIYMKEKVISIGYGAKNLKPVEMDLFDTFYSYGIVGVIIIYGYFLVQFIKYRSFNEGGFKYTLSFITILILGFFSGHVFWGAMSASILGIVVCGMISSKNIDTIKGDK